MIREGGLHEEARITSHILELNEIPPDSDMYTVRIEKMVAVVPLSLDFNLKN